MIILILGNNAWDKADHLFFQGKKYAEGVEHVHSDGFMRPVFITCTLEFSEVVRELMDAGGITYEVKKEDWNV